MKLKNKISLVTLVCFGGVNGSLAGDAIAPDQFSKLQTLIKPQSDEDRWAAIPWLTDLWQARQLAARQGKPILLWEMDGHPLGCT